MTVIITLQIVVHKPQFNMQNQVSVLVFRSLSLYPHPYVCFLDFESLNKKVDSNNTISQQVATQHAFGYKYCLINIIDKQNHTIAKERSYYGNDCVNDMLANLTDDWKAISSTLNYPLNISEEDRKKHDEKNKCDIC